ncbi:tetratricopeptide repeat protein [Desulfohalovibrio reitneri]|uniref:tetratricopeptide repeat protein n=1 Tax=Desulfohalovibrio reitneri TaxID=1307759 RepID=UPI0004A77BD1|nr:tetratricopeptide repeat protein [Desulfohalovibrio reitneri]
MSPERTDLNDALGKRIRDLPEAEPPEWLADAVMLRVAASRPWWRRWLDGLTTRPALAPALVAACLLLAFSGGFLAGGGLAPPASPGEVYRAAGGNAESSFLFGRGLLASGHTGEAVAMLSRAVEREPLRVEYRIWLDKALGEAGRVDEELRQYRKAAAIDDRSFLLRRRLAQGFLRTGKPEMAAAEYARILQSAPRDQQALLGRAEAMARLGRNGEAAASLKELLAQDIPGGRALRAVSMLNDLGDFTYRRATVGKRRLAIRAPSFEDGRLTPESRVSLRGVAETLRHSPGTTLHVVAFVEGNREVAKQRALLVKRELTRQAPGLRAKRIRTSWFGSPEPVETGSGAASLSQSIRIFGVPETTT